MRAPPSTFRAWWSCQRLAAAGAAYQTEDEAGTSGSQPSRVRQLSKKDLSDGRRRARRFGRVRKDGRILRCGNGNPAKLHGYGIGRGRRDGIWSAGDAMEFWVRASTCSRREDLMFPHTKTRCQSESVTHKRLPATGCSAVSAGRRKMSKSRQLYTLADLLLKLQGARDSLALIFGALRHQFNFTFDGLVEATSAIERLRHSPAAVAGLRAGENSALQEAA